MVPLFTVLAIFIISWILKRVIRRRKLPPGPKSLPFFGSWPFVPKEIKDGKKRLQIWMAEEFGPISHFQTSFGPMIFISDLEMIKDLLKKQEASGRPKEPKPFHEFRFGDAKGNQRGLLASTGQEWNEQRRFTIKNLRDFGFGKSSMEETINDQVEQLVQLLLKEEGKAINLNLKMNLAIVNALWYLLVGEHLELEDPKLQTIVEQFDKVLRLESRPSLLDKLMIMTHPQLVKWFVRDYEMTKQLFDDIGNLVQSYIVTHKNGLNDDSQSKDFMEAYLREIARTNDSNSSFFGKRGEESLISTMTDLFLAGTETTTSSLLWSFLCLLHYPDVQKKVQEELDEVVGNRMISLEDKPKLPYTNAVLMESMRIATIVPMALPHTATEEIEFNGYLIPKDSTIFPNILHVHYDPKYWADPDQFNPLRFYDEASKTLMPNERLIPFSVGKRFCLGQSLAEKEYFLFFCGILQKFQLRMAPGKGLPAIGKDAGTTIGILRGVPLYQVILEKRDMLHPGHSN